MIDCLLIGHNDGDFAELVTMVRGMGARSGAYRDLDLAFVTWGGRPTRALDVLNALDVQDAHGDGRRYHNMELLWPTIPYLGSFLDRHGLSFDYVNLFQDEKDVLEEKLRDRPRTVVVTTTLYVTPNPAMEVVRFVKERCPETTVIVGGPFVSTYAKQATPALMSKTFGLIGADVYVISSEGELALTRVLDALRDGRSLHGIPNVAFREGSGFTFNDTELEYNSLDENMVNYRLFSGLGEFVSLRTAKSCPFSCAFCGFPARAGKYTYLPVDLVEAELDRIREHETVTSLSFIDDTFNVPKGRFKQLLRMMIRKNYGFKWNCLYRSDHGDDETIELMAEAGCEGVFLGVESGSDTMLELMNKTARRKNYMRAIPHMRRVGIITHANLIVGFPGETETTLAETRSLLEEAQPDFFRAQLWYADPITPIWSRREEFGIDGSMFNWAHRTMDAPMASDLVEDLFHTVRGSTWLPQNGFELWSVFYLLRRGMSLDGVKAYLRAFNQAVGEKVGRTTGTEISPAAVDRLRAAGRFPSALVRS